MTCTNDPVVNAATGYTLDDIINLIIQDTDTNGNGLLDLEEVRKELLSRWSGGGMYKIVFLATICVVNRGNSLLHSMDVAST